MNESFRPTKLLKQCANESIRPTVLWNAGRTGVPSGGIASRHSLITHKAHAVADSSQEVRDGSTSCGVILAQTPQALLQSLGCP